MTDQADLFASAPAEDRNYPQGFRYQTELTEPEQERALVAHIATLPLQEFQFHGYTGKRRVVSYGWKYDYDNRSIRKVDDIPDFLHMLRKSAAAFAGLDAKSLQQALVTEYSPGSAIGWHRDKPEYAQIVGVSLLASCVFRLRRADGKRWERFNLIAEPRSVYLMDGESRSVWEHSIPPVDALRYSVTFRSLKEK